MKHLLGKLHFLIDNDFNMVFKCSHIFTLASIRFYKAL